MTSATSLESDVYDAIVVGGGFAGVTTARELTRDGKRVLMLEARDRLGGRTWYKKDALDGMALELGGTWVHWLQSFTWTEIQRHGLSLSESPTVLCERALIATKDDRRWMPAENAGTEIGTVISRCVENLRELMQRPHDVMSHNTEKMRELDRYSIADYIDTMGFTDEERTIATTFFSGLSSAPCSEVGIVAALKWFALSGYDAQNQVDTCMRYKIATGMSSLIDAMVADAPFEIRFDTEVLAVESIEEGNVNVATADGSNFRARAIVVTIPLNALGSIKFRPALDEGKARAIAEGQASKGTKAWAIVKGLPAEIFSAFASEDFPFNFVQTERIDGDQQLVVAFGPDGDVLNVEDPAAVETALKHLLGDDIEVVASTGHDWRGDRWSRGTWPMMRPRQISEIMPALQTPCGHIILAGSETSNGWNGFVDGAIESGYRAAAQVKELLTEDFSTLYDSISIKERSSTK